MENTPVCRERSRLVPQVKTAKPRIVIPVFPGTNCEYDTARAFGSGAVSYTHLPGFYGSMPDGSIKTFSRGGSDVTGAIVAAAASADLYENWTDVSGFFMADPRIVKNAKKIDCIVNGMSATEERQKDVYKRQREYFPRRESRSR